MRKSAWAIGAAAFAGVFFALQLDHFMHRESANGDLFQLEPVHGTPISMEPVSGPADFRDASQLVMPSVVSVDNFQRVGFFDDTPREAATGSGVILSKDGFIVTNNHVVAGAVAVRVRTNDHHIYNAKVLGTDPRSDLAVLKVDASNLKPIKMGDSDQIQVGQWVLAVGNPLGFDDTVSVGVVSSLKRRLPVGTGELLNAIQTDAAINPGNSGGALTDAAGRLIGINSAIASETGQSIGIGFAIPINRVREVVNDIVKYGHAKYGILGVNFDPQNDGLLADAGVRDQLAQITNSGDVPDSGVIVHAPQDYGVPSVVPGSGAERAGIGEWDVILTVNGEQATDSNAVRRILTPLKPGKTVKVRFWHRGTIKTVNVTLDEEQSS
jgi:S1-C subfamily serine protease